jgi:chromosome partitioning protein
MYDIRTKMAREILAELRSHFADRMFKTVVNFNTRIKEAASFGQPIGEYDPASKGQQDFRSLAQEVIGAADHPQVKSKRLVDSLADQLESIGASATELLKDAKPAIVAEPPRRVEPLPVHTAVPPQKVTPAPIPVVPVATPAPAAPVDETLPTTSAGVATDTEPAMVTAPAAIASVATVAGPTAEVEPELKASAKAAPTTDEKLSDYYGVSQIQDAVVFVTLYPRASSVQIAGDFNNWQPATATMQRVGDSGVWQLKMKLPHGTYRYRLVVDGQWQQDPYNERTELNPYGEYNSILDVR